RAPARPSGLGLSVVELLERKGNRLLVKGLDAIDGTPVLDVRPYMPQFDAFPDAKTPRFRHRDSEEGKEAAHRREIE
ncbi:MAG: SAM-dependent methyltransferase, partial [Clostridia bacterium]|nr:SAM-dependent methyltransferase [Clostridia bacterium]